LLNSVRFLVVASALSATLSACSARAESATSVVVDTLPGGIVRTMSSAPIDSGHWALVVARDIRPPEGDSAELLKPADLALADDGSVLVVESSPASIRVYDRNGRWQRTLSRPGDGPGEMRSGFIAVRGDTVVVQDPGNSRAQSFNWRTGALLSSRRTVCCYWNPIWIDGSGRVYVRSIADHPDSTKRHAMALARFALNGDAVDSLFAIERQDAPAPKPWFIRSGNRTVGSVLVPMQPRAHLAVDPTKAILTGFSSSYVIRESSNGLDTTALFGRSGESARVSAAEKSALVEAMVKGMTTANPTGSTEQELRLAFDAALIPDVRPAYEGFYADRAGRRWVRRSIADTAAVEFDLFDSDGKWLDIVRVPASEWPESAWMSVAFSETEVAVVIEDEDGRPFVRVYTIRRT
jgi:hypothetical protein